MSNRNATSSWHGYSHQSKVGVLLALRKIKELLEKGEPLENWTVEFESAEDIDIKHGNKVDSRHQVKTYKNGRYPNSYKDVLQEAYPNDNNGNKVKITQAFQYREMRDDGTPGEIEVEENSRYLHTIVNVIGFGLPEEEFRELAPPQAEYISNPNNIQLYQYSEDEKYCDFSKSNRRDKLEEYCIIEIKFILTHQEDSLAKIDQMHKNVFLNIVDALDNQVRAEHLNTPIGCPTLYFTDIYEILFSHDFRERTISQIMRCAFMNSWDEYEYELEQKHPSLDAELLENRRKIIEEIYLLNDRAFRDLIVDLNPDQAQVEDLAKETLLTTHVQSDSLKDVMYNCLISIVEQPFDKDYLGYIEGKYTLSIINRNKGSINAVVENLAKNNDYLNKIYERNYLINGQINNQKITPWLNQARNEKDSNWEDKKNHIMNPEMKFITATEAIKKINEG